MLVKLHINLLGRFSLKYKGNQVDTVDTLRLQELLAYLLIHRNIRQSRQYLAFLLWPESTEEQALSNFRNLLFLLRKALPNSDHYIQTDRKFIKWNTEASYFLDLAEFDHLIEKTRNQTNSSQRIDLLKKAVNTYRGQLLPSCYSKWIEQPRQKYHQAYDDALKKLVKLLRQDNQLEDAIKFAKKRIQIDKLNEAAWRILIKLQGENGNRATAKQTFNQCKDILKKELNVKPAVKTKQVYQQILSKNSKSPLFFNLDNFSDRYEDLKSGSNFISKANHTIDKSLFWNHRRSILTYLTILCVLFFVVISGYYLSSKSSNSVQTIAIMPLENLSTDPEQEYFAISMTDELNNYLSQIPSLRVISRNSIMQFKDTTLAISEIAASLDVKWILTGSVYRKENNVRILLQLVDATNDQNIWSKSYQRDLSHILYLQSEVAKDVTNEIRATLNQKQKNRLAAASKINPELFQNYLKAKYHLSKANQSRTQEAISLLKDVIEKDSTYAPAYALLGRAYHQLISVAPFEPDSIYPEAERVARLAKKLDPELAEPHFTLGWILAVYHWKWEEGISEISTGLNLNPNSHYGLFQYSTLMGALGYFDEAIAMAEHLIEIDPASPLSIRQLSLIYYFKRNYSKAIIVAKEALALDPRFMPAHFVLGLAWLEMGKSRKSIGALKKMYNHNQNPVSNSILAYAYARADSIDQAKEILVELESLNGNRLVMNRARIHVALGNYDIAIKLINEAVKEKTYGLFTLPTEASWDPLRTDPRFKRILHNLNLEPT